MPELIDRAEIPIQPLSDRDGAMSAFVPVYLGADALNATVARDVLDISSATDAVKEWYNEDMRRYLELLVEQGYDVSAFDGYQEFNSRWVLDAEPSEDTCLPNLLWKEDEEVHMLHHDPIPVVFHNRHDRDGEFYTSDFWDANNIFPLAYRSTRDPAFLFMPPRKMRSFGIESPELHARIDDMSGIAEVVGTSFNSRYTDSVARAVLLRNFGVHYMNQVATIVDTVN